MLNSETGFTALPKNPPEQKYRKKYSSRTFRGVFCFFLKYIYLYIAQFTLCISEFMAAPLPSDISSFLYNSHILIFHFCND